MNKVRLTWPTIISDCRALAFACGLKAAPRWSAIVAVTRGGLIPAAILSERMGIKIVDTLCIQSYEAEGQQSPNLVVLKMSAFSKESNLKCDDLLVVDDLVDSGETAKAVAKLLPGAHFACLYAKPLGRPHANTFIREYKQEEWIVFPWEVEA